MNVEGQATFQLRAALLLWDDFTILHLPAVAFVLSVSDFQHSTKQNARCARSQNDATCNRSDDRWLQLQSQASVILCQAKPMPKPKPKAIPLPKPGRIAMPLSITGYLDWLSWLPWPPISLPNWHTTASTANNGIACTKGYFACNNRAIPIILSIEYWNCIRGRTFSRIGWGTKTAKINVKLINISMKIYIKIWIFDQIFFRKHRLQWKSS